MFIRKVVSPTQSDTCRSADWRQGQMLQVLGQMLQVLFFSTAAALSSYEVPPGIGTPTRSPSLLSSKPVGTLADAAAAPINVGIGVSGAKDISERPVCWLGCSCHPRTVCLHRQPDASHCSQLNLDFIPRVGWRGTVFPSVTSPVLFSIASSAVTLWMHDNYGFSGIDARAHTVLGVLVSFLAVFRTQQAYR